MLRKSSLHTFETKEVFPSSPSCSLCTPSGQWWEQFMGLLCHSSASFISGVSLSPVENLRASSPLSFSPHCPKCPWEDWDMCHLNMRATASQRLRPTASHLTHLLLEPLTPSDRVNARTEEGKGQSFPQRKNLLLSKSQCYRSIRTGGSLHCLSVLKWRSRPGSPGILPL